MRSFSECCLSLKVQYHQFQIKIFMRMESHCKWGSEFGKKIEQWMKIGGLKNMVVKRVHGPHAYIGKYCYSENSN